MSNYLAMTIKSTVTCCFIQILFLIASQNLSAGTVYKWTDEAGIMHFSDVPPGDASFSDTQEINIYIGEDNNVDPDKYSVINQADRMAERRRQVTEERLAKKRLYLEEKRLALDQAQLARDENIEAQEIYQPVYHYVQPGPYYTRGPGLAYHPHNFRKFRKSGHGFRDPHSQMPHNKKFTSGSFSFKKFHSKAVIKF